MLRLVAVTPPQYRDLIHSIHFVIKGHISRTKEGRSVLVQGPNTAPPPPPWHFALCSAHTFRSSYLQYLQLCLNIARSMASAISLPASLSEHGLLESCAPPPPLHQPAIFLPFVRAHRLWAALSLSQKKCSTRVSLQPPTQPSLGHSV